VAVENIKICQIIILSGNFTSNLLNQLISDC
jgi:hypothetical protein